MPDDVIIGMVGNKLKKEAEGGILFDGFPRTVAQAEALDKIAVIDHVINLSTEADVIVKRICSRRMCRDCGAVLNTSMLEGKEICPNCGGELYIRDDDNEETVRKRFAVYEEQTAPLIDYYEKKGLVTTVEADAPIKTVAAEIAKALAK